MIASDNVQLSISYSCTQLVTVHEEGLACESFALHCKKNKQKQQALEYFQQAKACYTDWGSQMKVESITNQMKMLS